jgi:hypothetical protein
VKCLLESVLTGLQSQKNCKIGTYHELKQICRKLKPATVKAYLSSINLAHDLKSVIFAGDHIVLKSRIKGAENLSLYNVWTTNSRKVMTPALLKVIGHQIASLDWCKNSKLVVWTACIVAFLDPSGLVKY